ncbi:MAG: hypothetical protein SPI06_14485 [Terrisporobacter sp.]|uniref:hypothetical protein n=1 Tax=Terrisporobacter sp. TaxID=1965305 RepID=UPI002A90EC51|nr:hypothetical protein [Terrisporobacter sp.]MDY6154603.1 hypothetical protein [Terrisporobacter sp.]
MKCKDCCSYRPSDFDKDWGTCKESLLTVTTDKECSLLLKEKQSRYKIINGEKESANKMEEYIRDYNNISLDDIMETINYKILHCVETSVYAGKLENSLEELSMLQKAKDILQECVDEIYEERLEESDVEEE